MSSEIFANNKIEGGMDINGINWDEVITKLASNEEEANNNELPDYVMEYVNSLKQASENGQDDNIVVSKGADHLKEYRFKKKVEDEDEDERSWDKDEKRVVEGDEEMDKPKESQASFVFKSYKDIDGESLEKAIAAGDKRLETAIRKARFDVRKQVLANLSARTKVASELTETNTKNAQENKEIEFTSPTKFSNTQKETFIKVAEKNGFPKDYIEAMLCEDEVEDPIIEKIQSVVEAEIDTDVKKIVLSSFLKEASSDEARNAILKYYRDVLNYNPEGYAEELTKDPS